MPRPFRRRPPPFLLQLALGLWIYFVAAPLGWVLERLGLAEGVFRFVGARRERGLARKNPFRGYVAGEQDVFVMTFAKSGTNWMMQIAHQLIHHAGGEFDHLHDVVPWPDTEALGPFLGSYAIPLKDAQHWRTSPERKRVIKTHLNWERVPHSDEARYIAVIRDPKDVFVSSYFFVRNGVLGPAMPSLELWLRMYMSESFLLGGSWAVNAAGYWAQRARPNVLVVSFKSMKRDLRKTVVDVARFLNIRASDDVIDEVCRQSTFEQMKSIDHKFWMGKMIPWQAPGAMIRRGAQGGWSELVSADQARAMDAYFRAELERLGSDFPYDEFCDVTADQDQGTKAL